MVASFLSKFSLIVVDMFPWLNTDCNTVLLDENATIKLKEDSYFCVYLMLVSLKCFSSISFWTKRRVARWIMPSPKFWLLSRYSWILWAMTLVTKKCIHGPLFEMLLRFVAFFMLGVFYCWSVGLNQVGRPGNPDSLDSVYHHRPGIVATSELIRSDTLFLSLVI